MGVQSKVDILCKLIFFALEQATQQIVDTLIATIILIDVAEIHINIDVLIVKAVDIFLEFLCRAGELTWTEVYWFVGTQILAQVAPVAIHEENDVAHATALNNILQVGG